MEVAARADEFRDHSKGVTAWTYDVGVPDDIVHVRVQTQVLGPPGAWSTPATGTAIE